MEQILKLDNLHKVFNSGSVNENHVLKGIDLVINKGDFISVIGGNGAGKSTLLNVIAGSITPDVGIITLEDNDVTNDSVIKKSKYISRVFQDPSMGSSPKLNIEENLSLAYLRGKKRGLKKAVKVSNRKLFIEKLCDLGLGLEDRLKTEVSLLSGGQRQALTLLMATIIQPKVLLLDEHTAALDPKTTELVLNLTDKLIKENNLTSLMVTHDMEDAIKYGNRLIMLHSGKVVVDISGDKKKELSVSKLIELFHKNSGEMLKQDDMLLK
ncbi:putative ABC transport system ATP-binding protein [Bacilli bacterium PM5-9]|nr:putative ABC transport system ATP-binding protein [Bacilli bacterium PM5-9]